MARSALGAIVALVIGCGRFGFDRAAGAIDATAADDGLDAIDGLDAADLIDSPDAAATCVTPLGHDEDSDLIDDACDVCPHLADNQGDADADGVGDGCDLDGTTAQRITFFDTYAAARPEWNYASGSTTFGGDVMRADGLVLYATQELIGIPGRDRFEVAGHIVTSDPVSAQMSMGIGPAVGPGVYYCEIYEDNDQLYLGFTYTLNGSSYVTLGIQNLVKPFVGQDFTLSLDHTPPTMTCRAGWRGGTFSVTRTIPAIAAEQFYVAENRLTVDLRSFVRIHTD